MPVGQAIRLAEEEGLDLVEVAPQANPPVCRIMDYGKFKYQKKKRMQEAKKKQAIAQLKEIKLRYKTDSHDLATKIRQAEEFLEEGHKVKFVMYFKGREIQFANLGQQLMEKVASDLMHCAMVEKPPKMEGKVLTLLLTGKGGKRKGEQKDAKDKDKQVSSEKVQKDRVGKDNEGKGL